ncbi:MAG: glutamine-hydrolyzing carbamoyl-phosphate synthase small subunit [Phycisphaerales bacterium]|jgi:carbamoyl-phosphate synthase small subunit|nr:glutamine-hydrolyzing carbamoyl-phosphate synthase small subunit [Phycisphaerales bacterium]
MDGEKTEFRLALEDGTVVLGQGCAAAADVPVTGEVVFNTAMCGYQEALTDPSYAGQILIMTAPLIGNYGICTADVESGGPQVAGFVVREVSRLTSNYRAVGDIGSWLHSSGIPAMTGVDTRAIVRRIRSSGALRGAMTSNRSITDEALIAAAAASPAMSGRNLAAGVTSSEAGDWDEGLGLWGRDQEPETARWRVVVLDCGAKRNILRHLVSAGCEVTALPLSATAEEILAREPHGLMVSNGPGDPAAVEEVLETLRGLIGRLPIFGICLGHQLLALALGATTWKLPFGHRGANQPVRDLDTGRVEITSQNHGFCVDEGSLAACDCVVTHRHLNDGTVAGFRHGHLPLFAVQYHPEASPGPHDAAHLFRRFVASMEAAAKSPI